MNIYDTYHSYGHLLVITGYKWDYTCYKWGDLLVLITGIIRAITALQPKAILEAPHCIEKGYK